MGTGSTLRPIEEQVLPLTEWPTHYLERLQELLDTRAPELGVRLLVPHKRPASYDKLIHDTLALKLDTCPPWLKRALACAFPVGYVLRVCERCDLVGIDTSYRLGGWEGASALLEPAADRPW